MARKWSVFFRQVESLLKRGFRFILLGMLGVIFALGIPVLEIAQSREVSQTILPQATPQQLMERGRELYRSDRYAEAAEALQQAADFYAAEGNRLNQSLALSYLSLTYQKLGQREEAQWVSDLSLQLAGMGETRGDRIARAVALNSQGHLLLSFGNAESAFERWQNAAAEYQQLNDNQGKVGALVNQAQALEQMGYYRRSCNTLLQAVGAETLSCDEIVTDEDINSLQEHFVAETNLQLKAIALRSLGNVLRAIGKLDRSHQILQQTLAIVDKIDSQSDKSLTFFALANTEQALAKQKQEYGETDNAKDSRNQAVNFYKKAIAITPSPTIKLLAQLNLFSLLRQTETNVRELESLLAVIQSQMSEMTLNKSLVEARIKLACSLMQCEKLVQGETAELTLVSIEEIDRLLQQAVTEAKKLEDARLISYAIGTQGKRYESFLPPQAQKQGETASRQKAKTLTQEALELAVQNNAPELRYQWQWQMGRLLAGEGNLEAAIGNYTAAVETLNSLRNDLLAVNADVQFSFRDNVEPMYRQLVELLLPPKETKASQIDLQKALYLIDSLQVAELENYLQCNLQNQSFPNQASTLNLAQSSEFLKNRIANVMSEDSQAALIYPIILKNHLAVIVKLPKQESLLYSSTIVSSNTVVNTINKLRQETLVKPTFSELNDREGLVEIYQWLIAPFEDKLESENITTLAFVLDGALRSLPMSSLHDDSSFLVNKYAVALVPSIQLLKTENSTPKNIKVLAAGLSAKREDLRFYNSIEGAVQEIRALNQIFKDPKPTLLVENEFTKQKFQQQLELNSYNLVHLATHARFSSNLDNTIILTASVEPMRLNELEVALASPERNRTNPLWLFVLSACETAEGDNRAVLGIAGLSVKSGAQSTLATLWLADDRPTEAFMLKFYEVLLNEDVTKAEALRRAQQYLLENPSSIAPNSWAPFVLVGDWR